MTSDPTTTGPATTGPTSTGPTSTGPTSTGPTNTGPTSTGPTTTGPHSVDAAVADDASTDPTGLGGTSRDGAEAARRPGWGRVLGVTVGTAFVVGFATALVARLLMRFVAQAVGSDTGFSVIGTLGIAIVFSVMMVPAAAGGALEARTRRAVVGLVGMLVTAVVLAWANASTALVALADHPLREGPELDLVALLLVGFGATVVAGALAARRLARRWTFGRGA